MADQEIEQLLKLREANKQRLDQNRLQRALMGAQTPSHTLIDIQTAELEIEQIDAQLLLLHVSPEVSAVTGPDAGLGVVRLQVKQVGERLSSAIAWTQKEFSRERAETRKTLGWQNEQITVVQNEARATRKEAQETREELRETLASMREDTRLWRLEQEEKRKAGVQWYRRALLIILSVAILALLVAIVGFIR